jgi:hypothetical protein
MNRPMLAAVAVALLSSGCVVRASSPRVVVTEPVPPPVVVAPPPPVVVTPPPPVVVAPTPVVVYPPVLVSQPKIVVVPGTQVYTVPSASYNVFVYGGQYYSFHHGTWFHAARHGAAWTPVAVAAVPVQVRTVPAKHWKAYPSRGDQERAERFCPPGHAKKGEC